jgi:hypothetical protein
MIYTTFEQWVRGRFLETGEPRNKAYSQAELDLVEMGWNYGHDAGVQWQKGQEALDRKAENAKELGLDYAPQRTWVGLTDREKSNLWIESRAAIPRFHTYASLVEAKLKEKNT